jgi:hypothetical protein
MGTIWARYGGGMRGTLVAEGSIDTAGAHMEDNTNPKTAHDRIFDLNFGVADFFVAHHHR